MPEIQDHEELQSEEAESEDVEGRRGVFTDESGLRIAFYLHKSIKKPFSRQNLTKDIKKHGGIVLNNPNGADTVLVDVMYDKKETLQIAYNTSDDSRDRKVFVELPSFVQHCIQRDYFEHRLPALKGMGGVVGRVRVPFTKEDDERLCHYLARILPDKAAGGRLGLDVYKELVRTAEVMPSTHAWGARHTAESWKERYKKNAPEFDERIDDIVKREGRSRKQLWHEDRRAGQRALRGKHKYEAEEGSDEDDPSEEEYEEEEYEEERLQLSRKRRRADYSPPPPDRRTVQRSSNRQGKARAKEDERDEPDQLEDYMDQDEPGPSRSRRSLEASPVAVNDLTHRTQPNTASFLTQETIVASAPSGRSVRSKKPSHLPDEAAESSSLVRRSIRATRGAKQTSPVVDPTSPSGSIQSIEVTRGGRQGSPSGHEPSAVIDFASPSGSIGRNSPVIHLSPSRTLVNLSQMQKARPSTYKRPLKAARRPRAMIEAAAVDAPYKNTRSRSQSVEPYTSNSPVRESKKRGTKGKQKANPALAPVDEIQDDDGQGSENLEVMDESVPPPAGDNLADEIDVEEILISDQEEELDEVDGVSGESLDTDDAQTEQNLRPTQPPRLAFGSLQRHPSEILKEFQEHSVLTTATHPNLSNRPLVPVRKTQGNPGIRPPSLSRNGAIAYRAAEPPRTPLKRPRNNSALSMDLFPVSGTRASTFKNKLHQQEKRSPYNPPSGTQAARFARSGR